MTRLHLDLSNGAAGDMLIAALWSLFEDQGEVELVINTVASAVGAEVLCERVLRSSLSACQVSVVGGERGMTLDQMIDNLGRLDQPLEVVEHSKRVFRLLGDTERKIHGDLEGNHLHELGTVDTFVDVVGVLSLLGSLKVKEITSTQARLGCSQMQMAHGCYPNPAPAVTELLIRAKVPVSLTDDSFEYLTPTAAVLLAALSETGTYHYGEGSGTLIRVGYGAGHKVRPNHSGVLSAYLLEDMHLEEGRDQIYMVGVHVDDLSGEELGLIIDSTISRGALDSWITPVIGKKSRPGYEITILTKGADLYQIVEYLHVVTRSPGVRVLPVDRSVVPHAFEMVEVAQGLTVRVKYTRLGYKVEIDDAVAASKTLSVPVSEIVDRATLGFRKKRGSG